MAGLLVYIVISLLIYYVTVDWPWIVFGTALSLTMLGILLGVLLCKPAPVQHLLWQHRRRYAHIA